MRLREVLGGDRIDAAKLRDDGVVKNVALLLPILVACGDGGTGDDDPSHPSSGVFAASTKRVEIEIDYETGAEPFTGPMIGFGDTFDLSVTNLDRLFAGTRQLIVPRTVASMQDIGSVADEELTADDILALAEQHRDRESAGDTFTYYLVFVSGHFADASGPQSGVLGVSIGNSGVIAMFKDVIRGSSSVPNISRFVEQVTMIHELGHAIGLVDNGVPMVAGHKDTAHGAHCSNDRCAMFWQVEGASAAAAYAQQYVLTSDTIVFGDECLADVDALTGGP